MPSLTLGQMRGLISSSCWRPSSTDPQRTGIINKARELVYYCDNGANWKGMDLVVQMSVYEDEDCGRFITLPYGVETLIGLYDCAGRVQIRNRWFQFLRESPPEQGYCERDCDDLGDGFLTFMPPAEAGVNPVFSIPVDQANNIVIVIAGNTSGGEWTRETLTITAGGTSVTAANTYLSFTLIMFDGNQTNYVTMKDSATQDVYGIYSPGERTVNWRRYRLNSGDTDVINAICKRSFILITGDNDLMDISNVVAMEAAIRAYNAFENSDYTTGNKALSMARQFLNGELARYEGETEAGTIALDDVAGCGQIRNIL